MIEVLPIAVRMYEHGDPAAAFRVMVDSLADAFPLNAASWLDRDGDRADYHWPNSDLLSDELMDVALGTRQAAVLAFDSFRPDHAARYHGSEILVIPGRDAKTGVLVLIAAAGAFGEDVGTWAPLGEALGRISEQRGRVVRTEEERDTLRQRAEESEALHVLGLAANRTLDPDEVFELVARFGRTLLGAHYAIVSTVDGERVQSVVDVGLRNGAMDEDPLARRIIATGKPITVGIDETSLRVGELSFHAAEGMQVGIGVPLALFGETFGALVVGYRREYVPGPRDIRLALSLAGNAAVAISNARLHRALADRSRELERAYEELRWTAQAKERFFATTSHELRTPLNAILGYHSLLLDGVAGELPAQVRRYVGNANRATQTLLHLVNDILDLSRIEAGKLELVIRPVALAEILQDAIWTVRPLADSKGLRLVLTSMGDLPVLNTDGDRVRQILLNLLSNAINFTDDGEVRLRVESRARLQNEGGGVEIRVSDTGTGVAPEDQERIFHEFEQVIGATARGGTGLGLPISRKLARLLGGDLYLESAAGEGSTFLLKLPFDRRQ